MCTKDRVQSTKVPSSKNSVLCIFQEQPLMMILMAWSTKLTLSNYNQSFIFLFIHRHAKCTYFYVCIQEFLYILVLFCIVGNGSQHGNLVKWANLHAQSHFSVDFDQDAKKKGKKPKTKENDEWIYKEIQSHPSCLIVICLMYWLFCICIIIRCGVRLVFQWVKQIHFPKIIILHCHGLLDVLVYSSHSSQQKRIH